MVLMKFEISKYQIQITNLTMQIENDQFQLKNEKCKKSVSLKDEVQQKIRELIQLQEMIETLNLTIQEKIKKFNNMKIIVQIMKKKEMIINKYQMKKNCSLNNYNKNYTNKVIKQEKYKLNQMFQKRQMRIKPKKIVIKKYKQQIYKRKNNLRLNKQILNYWKKFKFIIMNQIYEKSSQLEKKSQLIDKFNLKIMNQNAKICQLKQQIAIQDKQIKQIESAFQSTEQRCEVESINNNKMNEITQLNSKLSKIIDEKEQQILILKQELQVSLIIMRKLNKYIKIKSIRQAKKTLYVNLNQISFQNLSYLLKLASHRKLKMIIYQQLQILQKEQNAILKENLILKNNCQIEDYKNKIALLSLEVSRYHNSSKGLLNQRDNFKMEDKTKFLSQEKGNNIQIQQCINNNYKKNDLMCLIVLLFAEIESLRTKEEGKKLEDKSKVQQIIDYYRQKPQ
ncbi:unnamed protein product [Paramecium sonneborni]|uniref:Uncharacterized protein n=1 Tax=Paramecium sonneborni TaxID=65129 RepID=A0A8S1RQ08_9CILI|nr:unnamed protein product [Paramecium sonneborni]